MRLFMKITLSALLLFFLLPPSAFPQQTLVLNTANAPPNATDNFTGIGDRVLTEAFTRLDMHLKIVRLPSERALLNANDGIDDGNFARVAGLSKMYPNLIQVPESITTFEFVAITKKTDFIPQGWDSLKPYNVSIITGWKILEKNITTSKSLTKVRNRHILFTLLKEDKTDIIVYDRKQGMVMIKEFNLQDEVQILKPAFAVKAMYPYLHKRHRDLVPRLAKILRDIKTDGSFEKIVNEVLAPYIK
ncbi:ABC transporter substrate-binding protein [Thermodesulfobacteriota bacterium]